jgi:predicted XRE-type DNA-binding protein
VTDDITYGSGNVFADLGLPDAVERQAKTRLAMEINAILKARRLKQVEAAALLAVPQPKISALVNYRLDGFSLEKLMAFLTALDQDIEILIRPAKVGEAQVRVHAVR